jgi:Berberine and berberine like
VTWIEILQAVLLGLVVASLALFTWDRRCRPRNLTGLEIRAFLQASDAMAFPHRRLPYAPVIVSQWLDAAASDKNVGWARDFWKALQPFARDGVYVNDLSHDDGGRVRTAYGANYERLTALKRQYDPHNLFRLNPNITPAP